MRMKKPLSIGFIAMLVLSMATLMVPTGQSLYESHNAQALWMDPSYRPTTGCLNISNTFDMSLMVNITSPTPGPGNGLYMWEYKLRWNTSWVTLSSREGVIESGDNDTRLGWYTDYSIIKDLTGTEAGLAYHWYAVSALAPAVAFTGVMWICNYTFHVEDQPSQPASNYVGNLTMYQSFCDDTVTYIFDGTTGMNLPEEADFTIAQYELCAIPAPHPQMVVLPKKTQGVCGELFNISIAIYNLVKELNLWGWEAKLKYDPAYLCPEASYEGPFLPSCVVQPSANTSYVNILNYTADTILMAGSFNDANHTAPECKGTYGVVSILEFNACVQTVAPDIVATEFGLFDIKFAGVYPNGTSYSIEPFDPAMVNGTYNVPYKVVGWFLDCYTDIFRKKCDAAYTGLGPNATADPYEPQDLVILYSYLEYNYEPEAYKLVTFEIHGPPNGVQNITIYRTAYTNADGIATINFTIPGSGIPDWQEMVMGHWECYQAAQVKIYEKPFDWLYWKVGWIIEIWDVEVIPGPGGWTVEEGPKKCEYIEIVVHFKTIAFIPKNVTFTVTVLDELLDPIQWEFWVVLVEPTEYYLCSERNDTTSTTSHIAQWAHVGKATVFVNAFTDLPINCGCPYCPEVTEIFWVVATADP